MLEWASNLMLRTLSRSGAVLCYHSVTTGQLPAASNMHVAHKDFEATLEKLRASYRIIPLIELLQRQQRGQSTRGLIAISFDDAYAGLLSVGELLGSLAIPITIFPVGEATLQGSAFWWDRVDDVFPHVAPARWRQFEDVCGVPEEYRRGQPESFGPLRPFRQWMLAHYHGRWPERLTPALTELEQETRHATVQRSMTWAEIAQLARQTEVHVGVHTLSHPVLPLLPNGEAEYEIASCFAMVSERAGTPVPILAAPFGLADARVVQLAQTAGMLATLSLSGTALGNSESVHWVPRICMSAGAPAWRLKLRLAGLRDGLWRRPAAFPVLPSAST